jgi:uncharacterized membrane protein
MTTLTIKKWAGFISPLWVVLGLLFFKYQHRYFNSSDPSFTAILIAWLVVGFWLATGGLRSRSHVSALAGFLTILGLLYLLWSSVPRIHG